jgi:hypothetical protein
MDDDESISIVVLQVLAAVEEKAFDLTYTFILMSVWGAGGGYVGEASGLRPSVWEDDKRGGGESTIFAYVISGGAREPEGGLCVPNGSTPGCARVPTAHIWSCGARGMVEARVGR